ncbi:MAG: hypothetical protein CM15mP114_10860 [Alphaproteobacteria bacterium]|nr:MAG: hypothetical protein CM15mP114_10860 [Alphaproteobacteria bacterium]
MRKKDPDWWMIVRNSPEFIDCENEISVEIMIEHRRAVALLLSNINYQSFSDIASGVTIVEPLLFEHAETNIVAAIATITKNLFMVGLLEGFLYLKYA